MMLPFFKNHNERNFISEPKNAGIAAVKSFIVKSVGIFNGYSSSSRDKFAPCEYDLEEIRTASEADSYLKIALAKYSYLIYKAGYVFKSENELAEQYIKTRFRIMSFATQKPIDIVFQEISDDLVKYSNAFLVKSRVDSLGIPGVKAKSVLSDKIVGGYFRLDPTTVKIKKDDYGNLLGYSQKIKNGKEKKFASTEVIHFYLDKESNNNFGTPRITAALEDVKLLRRIEGNVVSLIYRFSMPIYQWIVGLPQTGYNASDGEIKDAEREINKMQMDGVIITNEKTNIKVIGAEGNALDATNYLNYFEQRVFSALNVSASQMGRGGAKQDSDSMEAQTHDTVKYIQRIISIFTENYVINELLLEGGFNPVINEQDIVQYVFNEISLETKIKLENHEMLKFQSNALTFEESRKSLGKQTVVDESRLYSNMITNKDALSQIDAKADADIKVANSAPKPTTVSTSSAKGNGQVKSTKANKAVSTNNRPTNQHGTISAKVKESYSDLDLEKEQKDIYLEQHEKIFSKLYNSFDNLSNDIIKADCFDSNNISEANKNIILNLKTELILESYNAMQDSTSLINEEHGMFHLLPSKSININEILNMSQTKIIEIFNDITFSDEDSIEQKEQLLLYSRQRMRNFIEYIIPKTYWYTFIKTGAYFGKEKAYINFNSEKDEEEHSCEINTNNFSLDDIPAFHSFCKCSVNFKVGDRKNANVN